MKDIKNIRIVESLYILYNFRKSNFPNSNRRDSELLNIFLSGSKSKNIDVYRKIFLFEVFKFSNKDKIKKKFPNVNLEYMVFPELFGFCSKDYPIIKRYLLEQDVLSREKAKREQLRSQISDIKSRYMTASNPSEKEALKNRIDQLENQLKRQNEIINNLYSRLRSSEERVMTAMAPEPETAGKTALKGLASTLSYLSLGSLASRLLGLGAERTIGGIIGALSIASTLKKLGKIAYERYFSEFGKQCSGLSGKDRTRCIIEKKIDALNRQINIMRSYISRCNQTDDPNSCRQNVEKTIEGLQHKIAIERGKILKLGV